MAVESDFEIRYPVGNLTTRLPVLVNPRANLVVGFQIDMTAFGQQANKGLRRIFGFHINFALRPLGFPHRVALLVFLTRFPFSIRDDKGDELVATTCLAAFGIPAEIADNSSSFHLKNTIGLYIVRFCEALHL